METIEYKGHTINIYHDTNPENPRDWDNLGTMYCCHGRYNLGDEQPDPEWLQEYAREVADDSGIVLPLYLYDHSGITMNTTGFYCPWDSGQVGYIIATRQEVYDRYGVKRISPQLRKRISEYLRNEVETYDQYLCGEVYGYVTETEEGQEIDSCWGFFGTDWDTNGLLYHAESFIDHTLEELL